MKPIFTVTALSVVTFICAHSHAMGSKPASAPAKKDEAPAQEKREPQPNIVFKSTEYDFGQSKGADKIEHVFTFTNNGKATLKVDRVKTSCGCTAALLSSKEVAPGKSGEIKTTFTIGSRQGRQSKHIYVESNDPDEPKVRLTIKGEIIPPIKTEPRSLYFHSPDTEQVKTVTVTQTMDEKLAIEEVTSRLNLVETTLKTEDPLNGKNRFTVEVRLKSDIEPGRYSDNVKIKTNCAGKPVVDVPVRINIRGDIEAVPRRVNLGALEPGQEATRTIKVVNRKEEPFVIERVDIDNEQISVDLKTPTDPLAAHEITVKAVTEEESGTVRAKLTFHTTHPKQKTVEVNLYGYIRRVVSPGEK